MKDRPNLIFWMGDILTQSLLDVSTATLGEFGFPDTNLLAIDEFLFRRDLFYLGKISKLEYFKDFLAEINIGLDPAAFIEKVKENLQPDPRVANALGLLPPKYKRWLVCELPPSWFRAADEKFHVTRYFLPEQVLFLQSAGLKGMLPDLFDWIHEKVGDDVEKCLYFDKDPARVIAAINLSFPAVIYVDHSRLVREFVMRNFIDRPQPLHKPPVSL